MSHIEALSIASRDPIVAAASKATPRTLAEVIERIDATPSLSGRAPGDLKYGVRRLAKALGKPPEEIPAQPHVIKRMTGKIEPAAIGLNAASWSNALSLAFKALEITGCYIHPGKFHDPLSPAFAALNDSIENKYLRYGLSRFLHYASAQDWDPAQIEDAHVERYCHHIENVTLSDDPARECRNVRLNWNKAVETVPGWPAKPVAVPHKENPKSFWLKWSEMPALHAEVQRFLAARAKIDYFAEDQADPLKPRTLKDYDDKLRAYASALVRCGRDVAMLTDLGALVDPETFKEGLRFFLDRHGGKTSSYISGIASAVLGAARYLAALTPARIDESQVKAIDAIRQLVHYKKKGLARRNKDLLRLFADPKNVAKILFLPARLMRGVRQDAKPTVRDAQRVQMALAIEIEEVFPIREGNLAALHIKDNIVRAGPHKDAKVFIVIRAEAVKNGVELEVELPRSAVDLLDLYIKRYRPLLNKDGGEWLFPGGTEGHKHPRAFGEQIQRVIRRETGLPVNVHFFRHLSAKLWLDRNPGQFEVIQRVLGHRSTKTTINFYAEFRTIQACALYDSAILKLREELAHLAT